MAGVLNDRSLRLLWILFVGMSAADCLSTGRGLALGFGEHNPVASFLYEHGGVASLWASKAVVVGVMLLGVSALPRRAMVAMSVVLAVVTAFTVHANLLTLAAA